MVHPAMPPPSVSPSPHVLAKEPAVKRMEPDPGPGSMVDGFVELVQHRRLLWAFVINDLRHRYTGSSIGFFWTVITPLLELVTYTFVFHVIIGVEFSQESDWSNYALYLFCGMVTWFAVHDGLTRATTSVTDHGHLIQKVSFPAITLPAYVVVSAVLNQLIRLGVLMAAAFLLGHGLSWHILLVPVVILFQTAFSMGAGLILATANVFFKDTTHWASARLLIWMFITPVFHPASVYPPRFGVFLQLNPLAHLVGVYRQLILNHQMPHPHNLVVVVVLALFSLVLGYSVFHHHRDRFSDLV